MAGSGSGGIPPFGEDFGSMRHGSLVQRLKHGGHRPPEEPRRPRFGLLRLIRSGPPVGEDFGSMRHGSLVQRLKHDGHRPPKGPKRPRFGLLRRIVRRIVRRIRGGGD